MIIKQTNSENPSEHWEFIECPGKVAIDYYALETHSDDLYNRFIEKFKQLKYEVVATIDLVHAPPMKTIFAKK